MVVHQAAAVVLLVGQVCCSPKEFGASVTPLSCAAVHLQSLHLQGFPEEPLGGHSGGVPQHRARQACQQLQEPSSGGQACHLRVLPQHPTHDGSGQHHKKCAGHCGRQPDLPESQHTGVVCLSCTTRHCLLDRTQVEAYPLEQLLHTRVHVRRRHCFCTGSCLNVVLYVNAVLLQGSKSQNKTDWPSNIPLLLSTFRPVESGTIVLRDSTVRVQQMDEVIT